jgi:hypothetical protein
MDAVDATMAWAGLVLWLCGIALLIPEPPDPPKRPAVGTTAEPRQGATMEDHDRRCDGIDPVSARVDRHFLGLLSKWRPLIGLALLFAALALLIPVAVAIT